MAVAQLPPPLVNNRPNRLRFMTQINVRPPTFALWVSKPDHFPRPFGVFYETERPCYEEMMQLQIQDIIAAKGKGDLDKLLRGREVWEIA